VRFAGALDVAVLENCLNTIIRRHETLRSTIETVEGQPVVRPAPELALRLTLTDLSSLPRAEREAEALRLARAEALQSFDLAHGPLVRGRLFRLAADEHLFLLVLHHIVCDGWSVGVLTREVAALYTALSRGLPASLPPLPVQYADYAYCQRQWLQGEALQRQLDYWKQQLADAPAQLDLPADRPRPALQSYRGARYTFALSQRLTQQVAAFSRAAGVTTFATLLAGFQALLWRYTGQDDLCTGAPVANRTRAEVEGLIGFFVNTLVIRTDFSAAPTFRALVGQVAETVMQAFANQDVPFEMVVDAVRPARDLSRTPLFQVMFALQNTPLEPVQLPSLTITPAHVDGGTSKFDLTLFLQEREGELRGLAEYNTDLFDAATIARLMTHFRLLLEAALVEPERPVSVLPFLSEAERRQLLVEWNRTAQPFALDAAVHARIAAQAARTPDRVAVLYEGAALTYAELNARADRIAQTLRARGIGPDSIVGLCLERSVELIVGLLAIWKAGGAYLPLDPGYPAERLAFMLEDSGAALVITQSHLVAQLPQSSAQLILLDGVGDTGQGTGDRGREIGAGHPQSAIRNQTSEISHLAYVIYTSGSTGRPKGALIEHRSAVNLGETLQRVIYAPLGEGLRLSLNAPLSFDASVQHILLLMFGHTLCIVPPDLRLDGEALLAWIRRVRLDGLDCVPSQLKLLIAAGLLDGSGWAPRAVLPGGEAIDEALWKVLAQAPATEFYNVYGPTECACDSTIGHVRARPDRPVIGRPVDNAQLYVLDPHGQPVPIGAPGELYIGGAGVGRGYLNRPELTAEKFQIADFRSQIVDLEPQSASSSHESKIYRTGDLVRYLPDGNLEFLGRLDDQVKVRGYRIELGEIEAALKGHAAVRDAVVVAREDAPGVKRLVAYWLPSGDDATLAGELRDFLKQRLPDYMLPSAFVKLNHFPLTPSGKVDRRALPAPDQDRPALESVYVGPRTEAEATLAGIWAQVLGVRQVGVRDNFFELGGDSILSIQVIARAARAGLRLTPRQFFQYPTIEGLAAVAAFSPAILAEQGLVRGPVPLIPIQRHFFAQPLSGRSHWNQAFLLETREQLDHATLHEAVAALLQHHDALRQRFTQAEAGWSAHFAPGGEAVPMTVENLAALPGQALAAAIEARCAAVQASLNLSAGPLMRVVYFDCGPTRPARLLLVIHHLVVDGVSWRVLFEDLQTAYAQLQAGQAVALPAKTTSFKAWAEKLIAQAVTEATLAELPYWETQLTGARLPLDTLQGANDEASAQEVRQTFSEAETRALLQDAPVAYGADLQEVLLTALTQAVAEWTGAGHAWVVLESHGREDVFDDVDVSRTVGWFTTLFPVRLELAGADGPGAALVAIKEQLRRLPRRGLGFGLLRYVNRRLAEEPLPDLSFNYLGQFDQLLGAASAFRPAAEDVGPSRSPRAQRQHMVDVTGSIVGGRLHLAWTYSRNRHQRATIEQLAESFALSLRDLIAHCQSPAAPVYTPSDFPEAGLEAAELAAVLGELSETQ
jgi:amino acid adenylation domain-containing protein/non-ribosomal peptide synthase protein (TIGR01720 family)